MKDAHSFTIPFGKNRGAPIGEMDTPRLFWLLSRDYLRWKYPDFTRAALEVLQDRLRDLDQAVTELTPLAPPPARWKKERKKLQAMVEPLRRQVIAARAQRIEIPDDPEKRQILDAAEFVRAARRDQSDGSDLV